MFTGRISNVEDRGVQDFGFGPKNYVNLVWEIFVPNRAPMPLKELYNLNFDLKSNLFKRVFSILNADPGASFDVCSLIGTVRQVVVQNQPDKKGIMRSRITAVLPINQPVAVASAPVATPAPVAAAPAAGNPYVDANFNQQGVADAIRNAKTPGSL
jgi:hypothetical protein